MYYLEWRGYGLLGFVPPPLGLVAFGFLSHHPIRVAALGAGLAIAVAGISVAVVGWVLNRYGNFHSLYSLPLWVWGGVETILGLVLAGWVAYLVAQSGWKRDSLSLARPLLIVSNALTNGALECSAAADCRAKGSTRITERGDRGLESQTEIGGEPRNRSLGPRRLRYSEHIKAVV
jgi:hypothetical protein